MGSFVLTAPSKALIKCSSEVIEEIVVNVGGTKHIWLESRDSTDKLGVIGDGWRQMQISQGEIAQDQAI